MMEREISFREIWIAAEGAREIVRKTQNWGDPKNRYIVDQSVFKKTSQEKALLATLKLKNKEERKKFYGKNYKKYLNIPEKSLTLAI